ncbi:hypothetical protein SRHO_G00021170 [Serrasalmus rhombeus]
MLQSFNNEAGEGGKADGAKRSGRYRFTKSTSLQAATTEVKTVEFIIDEQAPEKAMQYYAAEEAKLRGLKSVMAPERITLIVTAPTGKQLLPQASDTVLHLHLTGLTISLLRPSVLPHTATDSTGWTAAWDVELYEHCCDLCTAKKALPQQLHAPLQSLHSASPIERAAVHVLVAMDYFTKWPEAYADLDHRVAMIAEQLVEEFYCWRKVLKLSGKRFQNKR